MIEEKLTGIPAVKLASDRLFRSFFFPATTGAAVLWAKEQGGGGGVGGALWASVFIGPNLRDI